MAKLSDISVLTAKLNDVRVLTVSAMMLALATILGFLKVPVTQLIELRFAFLPIACTGMLFGPAVGAIVGGMSDILGFIVKPTGPYFPGFMISEMLTAMIYGLLLYKKPISLPRIIVANTVVTVFVNTILNTVWLSMLYGNAISVILPARVVKELILLPINIAMFYVLSRMLEKAKIFRSIRA